jgi:hypothetical protein
MNIEEIKLKNRLITVAYRSESAMRFAPAALIRLLPRWSVVIFYTSRKSKI